MAPAAKHEEKTCTNKVQRKNRVHLQEKKTNMTPAKQRPKQTAKAKSSSNDPPTKLHKSKRKKMRERGRRERRRREGKG
jgi:hypothetical protein